MAKTAKELRDELKIVTPEFRGSFVSLVKPRAYLDKEPTYQITIVLPKESIFWKELDENSKKALKAKFGVVPDEYETLVKNAEVSKYPEHEGCLTIRAENTFRSNVVDSKLQVITDPEEIYSGAWYRASVAPWAWDHKKTNRKGVSLNLINVMKVKDGEPFTSRSSPAEDFADYVDAGDEGEVDPLG